MLKPENLRLYSSYCCKKFPQLVCFRKKLLLESVHTNGRSDIDQSNQCKSKIPKQVKQIVYSMPKPKIHRVANIKGITN